MKSGQPAITRGLDRLDALCRGRTSAVADVRIFNFPISGEPEIGWQPVKGLDRLSGDWRAIKRAPIALDRLPPPARLHPSDQGPRQGRAPLRLLHHFCTHSRFKRGLLSWRQKTRGLSDYSIFHSGQTLRVENGMHAEQLILQPLCRTSPQVKRSRTPLLRCVQTPSRRQPKIAAPDERRPRTPSPTPLLGRASMVHALVGRPGREIPQQSRRALVSERRASLTERP